MKVPCFLSFFFRYFIFRLGKGVRKAPSHNFDMKRVFSSTRYDCHSHITLVRFAHSGDIYDNRN